VSAARPTLESHRTGQTIEFLKTSDQTDGRYLLARVTLAPGGHIPRHGHLRQDERVRVSKGRLIVKVGNRSFELGPGEVARVPRRRVHTVRNAGPGMARFDLEVRPARHMQQALTAIFTISNALSRHGRGRT
jgi:mannose-6-phosphate isomerase-like protein (cupin superfamily)